MMGLPPIFNNGGKLLEFGRYITKLSHMQGDEYEAIAIEAVLREINRAHLKEGYKYKALSFNPKDWLVQTGLRAINKANRQNATWAKMRQLQDRPAVCQHVEQTEQAAHEAMLVLNDYQKSIVEAHTQGQTFQEIAKVKGKTRRAIYSAYRRALARMGNHA